jgi:DNA-binding transcriptional LysR family regulator
VLLDLRARHLRTFVVLVDELHFGRAARRLGTTQSAVSQQIQRLEEAFGTALLVRTSRSVALTAAGEALAREAADLLERVEGIARSLHAIADGRSGSVTLGAQGGALISVVPAALSALAEQFPELRVQVRQLTTREQLDALLTRHLDLALVRNAEPDDRVVLTELAREPVMAVLPANHPLAATRRISLRRLAGEPLVLWGRGGAPAFHDALVDACHAAGFEPDVQHRVRGIDARLSFIAAGLGVGLEAAGYRDVRRAGVVFRPLRERIEATIQLAHLARPLSPAARRVADAFLR